MKRSAPIRRGKPPARRSPVRKVNRKRKASEFARTYHSIERVEFVKSLPCCACGVVGFSENAHVGRRSGMGRKGPYTEIAPLCGPHLTPPNFLYNGCHYMHDEGGTDAAWQFSRTDFAEAANATERRWCAFQGAAT